MLEEIAVLSWPNVLFHRLGPRMPDSTYLWLTKLSVTDPGPGRLEKCWTLPLLLDPEVDKQPPASSPSLAPVLGREKPPPGWLTSEQQGERCPWV